MKLSKLDQEFLDGKHGKSAKKSMEILTALGEIYGAEHMIDISSVQVAGVSYDNLGEAGLDFLAEMAEDGRVRVLTTLNPAGNDIENWEALGISEEFQRNQKRVIEAFAKMGIITTCSCTPYLIGNLPHFNEHIAWSESSAVCFVNSVIGARSNREGGPSALAAALTGRTPEYGLHLDRNRVPEIKVEVTTPLEGTYKFGALGKVIGERTKNKIVYITGIPRATTEELKSFCASVATYGGVGLFYMEKITPGCPTVPSESTTITQEDIEKAIKDLKDNVEIDFVSIGCPHASLKEIEAIAELLKGKKVMKETWITTARPVKRIADQMGFTKTIESAGAKFASDTCCVVAPIKGRFTGLCTDSAKSCFYARGKNKFGIKLASIEECIEEATS